MNLRNKNGSITIFVLVGLLFMSAFLVISYASNVNRSKIAKEQFNIMSEIYSKGNDEASYTDAYTDLRNKNKQVMNASSEGNENTGILELTKTFEEKISNYKIYGNSIQEGTPSPENPIEVQSVGDLANLFNPNQELEKVGVYLGINTDNFDTNYTLQIKLKEGKTVPEGIYFGFVYYKNETSTAASANWLTTSSGGLNTTYGDGTTYALTTFNPSEYYKTGICCHSGTQANWDSIMDAFEITLVEGNYTQENIPEYIQYGKYKISVKITDENGESSTTNIYLDEPLRKLGDYADYIDFKNGKVIRNIAVINSYNNESISNEYISTTGDISVGATVYYVLDTQVEESISIPELSTFEDYTKIEVLTDVSPSKIEVEYTGYTV